MDITCKHLPVSCSGSVRLGSTHQFSYEFIAFPSVSLGNPPAVLARCYQRETRVPLLVAATVDIFAIGSCNSAAVANAVRNQEQRVKQLKLQQAQQRVAVDVDCADTLLLFVSPFVVDAVVVLAAAAVVVDLSTLANGFLRLRQSKVSHGHQCCTRAAVVEATLLGQFLLELGGNNCS